MKKRLKYKNIVLVLVILICLTTFTISLINIFNWKKDGIQIKNQVKKIEETTDVKEIYDNENTEIIQQPVEISQPDPYWDYIKMNMINVDFSELKLINSDVRGWIQVNGTNINYPFVQAADNSFYLTHSFEKQYNKAGWVFLDYRNKINTEDKNTILYAHGRLDNIMFGGLKNIVKSNWYSNSNNYVIKLSTEYENTLWQVFSIYHIPTTSDYLQISFSSDKKYQEFLDKISKRSVYNFNTTLAPSDNILTLSTCYNENEKVVMHAKLIKREIKKNN